MTRLLTLRTLKLASQADEAGSPRIALAATRVSKELVETSLRAKTAVRLAYLWEPVEELVNALLMRDTVSGSLASRIIRACHPGPRLQ